MDVLEVLQTATDGFQARVDQIGDDQWTAPTPCEGWDVRALVLHLVNGGTMSAVLLAGATREEALASIGAGDPGGDLRPLLRAATEAQQAAFASPGALEVLTQHPVAPMPGRALLGVRVGDVAGHTWDLARALGLDERLDPAVVELSWATYSPLGPALASTGIFGEGPSQSDDDRAVTQDRLLDLFGRRP